MKYPIRNRYRIAPSHPPVGGPEGPVFSFRRTDDSSGEPSCTRSSCTCEVPCKRSEP